MKSNPASSLKALLARHLVALCITSLSTMALPALAGNGNAPASLSVHHPAFTEANTCANEPYMEAVEREVVQIINLARIDAAVFVQEVLLVHRPDTTDAAVMGLLTKLRSMQEVAPLKPLGGLHKSATLHNIRWVNNGTLSRADGNQPYYDRIHMFVPGAADYAEVTTAGPEKAVDIALALLLDRTDPHLRTQRALLSARLTQVGCSVKPHPSECSITTVSMTSTPAEKPNVQQMKSLYGPGTNSRPAPKTKVAKHDIGWSHCPTGKKRRWWWF